jgi:hypothetical protein
MPDPGDHDDAVSVITMRGTRNMQWYDANGVLVYGNPDDLLVHFGYANLALTEHSVVDLASASTLRIVGLPDTDVLAVRAVAPASFWVAVVGQGEGTAELWQVNASGAASLVGAYPALPPGIEVSPFFPHRSHALEATGALLHFGEGPAQLQDVIGRREVGGSSAVVYDEATGPIVQIHISSLVTGP